VLNAIVLKGIAFSPFIQDAKRRHLAWSRSFDATSAAPLAPSARSRQRGLAPPRLVSAALRLGVDAHAEQPIDDRESSRRV